MSEDTLAVFIDFDAFLYMITVKSTNTFRACELYNFWQAMLLNIQLLVSTIPNRQYPYNILGFLRLLNDNFQIKMILLLYLLQNIDCGYLIERALTTTSNHEDMILIAPCSNLTGCNVGCFQLTIFFVFLRLLFFALLMLYVT